MTSPNKNLRITFISAIFFLLLLSVFTYSRFSSLIQAGQVVNHTTQVTLELERTIGSLKDAETGFRGYLLTHDKRFLEPFIKGLKEYPLYLQNLKELIIDNPSQQENLKKVETLTQHRKDYLYKILEVDKHRKPTADEMLLGKSIMDSLRSQITIMVGNENNLMQEQTKHLQKQMFFAPAMILFLSVIAFLILIISYWQLSKSLLRSQQLQIDVINNKAELEKNKLIEASEVRMQNIFNNAPAAIAIYEGADYKYILANKGYEKLTNRKAVDILGKSFKDVFPELRGTGIFELFDTVFINGKSFTAPEYSVMVDIKNDGVLRQGYFNFSMEPLKNEAGEIYAVVAMAYDITEQVETRKKIEESEAYNRSVLESSPDCVKVLDAEGRLQFMNVNGLCTMEIDDFSVFKNKPWNELWGEENKYLVNRAIDKALAGNTASFKAFCPTAKGTPKWWDVLVSPVVSYGSNKINSLISVSRDVTEQMIAQKKIEESEKRYNLLLMQSPFAFLILKGKDMVVHLANESMKDILGKGANIEGKPILEVLPELKDQPFPALLDNVFKTGIPFAAHEMLAQLTRNGKLEDGYYNYVYQPYYEADNTISGVTVIAYDVTSYVIANKKIIENEQEIRKIKDQLELSITAGKIGVWHWDVKNDVLYWSNEQKAIYGLEPSAELLNVAQYQALVIPEDWERLNKDLQNAPMTEEQEYDFRIIRKNDGALRWIKSRARNILDEEGELQFISGVNIDVTDQVLNLNKIQESEERFRSLAQALPQLTWVTDEKGVSEFASTRWKDYSGIEYVSVSEWKAIVHPDDYDAINAKWLHSLTTGEFYKFDVRLLNKNGEYRWHTVNGEPIVDKENKILKWVGAFTDTHVEKTFASELEMQIKNRTAELAKLNQTLIEKNELLSISEAFNRSLTDISPNVVYIHDVINNEPVFLNRAGLSIIGRNNEEALKNRDLQGLIIHPEDLPSVIAIVERIKQTKNNEIVEHEYRIKDAIGNWIPFLARDTVFKRNENNEVTHLLGIAVDVSELKKVEKKLLFKNSELAKMNKELESFVYISSHDLQEPLRKIHTFATRIIEKEANNLSDNGKDMFNRMHEAAKRMQQLIQDLLVYSKTKSQERIFEKTNLNKILIEVLEDFQEEINEKNAIVEVSELSEINIIPFQFRQLLYNLIGNALKFSRPNIPPHLKIKSEMILSIKLDNEKLRPQNNYCHITFSDNGIGFEKQYSEKIFEVFQRLHGKDQYPGTGIGLAIVKKIVDNHNGFITATSTIGKGSTFNIYIPV